MTIARATQRQDGRHVLLSVYSDDWLPLLEALGRVEITRASDVEWHGSQWVATLRSTGEIIAAGRNRQAVVAEEVKVLESRIRSNTL